jgi:hypothetical protein
MTDTDYTKYWRIRIEATSPAGQHMSQDLVFLDAPVTWNWAPLIAEMIGKVEEQDDRH